MADISLGTLRDYWKAVSDWVQGNSADKPEIAGYDSTDDAMKTKQIGSIVATKREFREGSISADTFETLVDVNVESIIHAFTFAGDDVNNTRFTLDIGGQNYEIVENATNKTSFIDGNTLSNNYDGLFELIDDTGPYVIRLKKEIKVNSFKIEFRNNDSVSHNITSSILWSEVHS